VENTVTVELVFHTDTFELDINAMDLNLDFAMSLLERGLRLLRFQEKILIAQQASAAVRQVAIDQERTKRVLDRVKLQ
jgi:exonuclease VII small subunit